MASEYGMPPKIDWNQHGTSNLVKKRIHNAIHCLLFHKKRRRTKGAEEQKAQMNKKLINQPTYR
jgi:hypothetical protein